MVDVLAVSTGVVVIVVAVAVVLVVLLATSSLRGSQQRHAEERNETRHDLEAAQERASQAEHERDAAQQPDRD